MFREGKSQQIKEPNVARSHVSGRTTPWNGMMIPPRPFVKKQGLEWSCDSPKTLQLLHAELEFQQRERVVGQGLSATNSFICFSYKYLRSP